MVRNLLGVILLFSISLLSAQAQILDSLLNIDAFTAESDLQKQLNKASKVGSGVALTTRETPGILSVVTSEEIQNSGARDITDVLRLIPGFDIAQDLLFVQGISLRGNWANEGKVLVLMDGQPLNDLLYQTVALGNRFPVDAIDRIEIIRGPGSAIYGGSAEYGVINIITKAASSLNGVYAYGTVGLHNGGVVGRTNAGVSVAQKGTDFSWDLSVFKGNGILSDQPYQDYEKTFPEPVDLSKTSSSDPTNINVGLKYKDLSVRMMYDAIAIAEPGSHTDFKSYFLDASYKYQVNDKLTLTPKIQFIKQHPWDYDYYETPEDDFDSDASRTLGQIDGLYTASRKVSLNFGALYFQDVGTDNLEEETLKLNNIAVYAQALFKHRLANATIGFRFEKNNRYDGAFVPRIALTKKIENFHFKLLYSKAFRSPSIQNIKLDTTGAKPEISNVIELELGYQFTPEMLLAVNAFYISTKDVLIYGSEGLNNEWYENYDKSGSKGIEAVYSIRKKKWYMQLSYSFSQALSDNTVDQFEVPQTKKQYVAQLAHKVTLNGSISLTDKFSINPSLIYGGKRFAYTGLDQNDEPLAEQLDPYVLANIFLNYKNLVPGMTIGLGVYDLFNERPVCPQAYNSDSAPMPGRSREYVLKLSYQLNFKSNEK